MKITGITKQGFHYSVDDAVGDDWELIDEEGDNDEIQYYSKGGQTEALFTYNNGIYLVRGDVTLSELKSIVHNLE